MTKLIRSTLVFFYSLLTAALAPVVRTGAKFVPAWRAQLAGRRPALATLRNLARERSGKPSCAVFFCSSAGEYEQAKPLIDRLMEEGTWHVQIVFFSRSGYDYAEARGETVPYLLSPADTIWNWGEIFSALRPDLTVVVRHELWPAFLETAKHWGRLILIDASLSRGETSSRAKRLGRRLLLSYFDKIYVVSDEDKRFFTSQYALSSSRIVACGDTKYDRVLERAGGRAGHVEKIASLLDRLHPERKFRAVIGSAHPPDVEVVLQSLRSLKEDLADWQLIFAPHHVDPESINWLASRLESEGLDSELFSTLEHEKSGSARASSQALVTVIIDRMGLLAEIYGCCDAAFVGGAMNYQVHNVLEPASHGLALAFGPFYKNSPEAIRLVDSGLAHVTEGPESLTAFWRDAASRDPATKARMLQAVDQLRGASRRILHDWNAAVDAR